MVLQQGWSCFHHPYEGNRTTNVNKGYALNWTHLAHNNKPMLVATLALARNQGKGVARLRAYK